MNHLDQDTWDFIELQAETFGKYPYLNRQDYVTEAIKRGTYCSHRQNKQHVCTDCNPRGVPFGAPALPPGSVVSGFANQALNQATTQPQFPIVPPTISRYIVELECIKNYPHTCDAACLSIKTQGNTNDAQIIDRHTGLKHQLSVFTLMTNTMNITNAINTLNSLSGSITP